MIEGETNRGGWAENSERKRIKIADPFLDGEGVTSMMIDMPIMTSTPRQKPTTTPVIAGLP